MLMVLDHGFQEVFIRWENNSLEGIHVKKIIWINRGETGSNVPSEGVTMSTFRSKSKEDEHTTRGSFSLEIEFMGDNATYLTCGGGETT